MQLLSLDQIIDIWEKDAAWDDTEFTVELTKIAPLHAKYLRQYSGHSTAAKAKQCAYTALRKVKSDYFNGRMDEAELIQRGLKPFGFILKGDINTYIDADSEILVLRAKIAVHEEAKDMCTYILQELKSRTFQIKEAITWERFKEGG